MNMSFRKSFLLKKNSFLLNKINKKNFYYTVGEKYQPKKQYESIHVYTAPEIKDIVEHYENKEDDLISLRSNQNPANIWKSFISSSNSPLVKKYFALIPMFIENKFSYTSDTRYILEMSLIPEIKHFRFKCLESSGVVEYYERLEDIVPITPSDYCLSRRIIRSALPDFVDGDMIYSNSKTQTIIFFDKQGTWHKEGVNHELLNLEKAFNEKRWFDYLYYDTQWK